MNSRNLRTLDVSKNEISGIEDGAFLNLGLENLDLSQNRIKFITTKSLQVSA